MDLDKINQFKETKAIQQDKDAAQAALKTQLGATIKGASHISKTIIQEANKSRNHVQKVQVTNNPTIKVNHTNDYAPLLAALANLQQAVSQLPKNIVIPKTEKIKELSVDNLNDYSQQITELIEAVKAIEVSPKVTVKPPEVVVPKTEIDLSSVNKRLDEVTKAIKNVKTPEKVDFTDLEKATLAVKKSIESLSFPVPNYILPFRDPATGKATQVLLDSDGKLPISGSISVISSGSAIQDGADSSIEATVLDKTNANPLATAIVDANGDQITSFGGGVQYTEGDTDTSITGTAVMWEDASDTMRAVSTSKPLPVVQTGTPGLPTGASTSAKQDTIIGHLDGVEGLLTDIEADTDTLAVVGGGTEAAALRITVANDSTGVLSVDDNGGSLTVDNAGLTELAAAINSSKVDVNIVSSDVASGGTSTADDADFSVGTTAGTIAQGVYESSPTSVTDGDVGAVGITSDRRLKTSTTLDTALPAGTNNIGDVDVLSSALPTGASTSAKQDTQITAEQSIQTSVELIDDAIKTDDAAFTPATTKVMMAGFEVDDTSPDSVDEGDAGAARMSSRREVYTQIRDAAGNERGANVNASGQLAIAGTVTNTGTFAVQVDGNALTALQLIDDPVATLGTTTYTEDSTKGNIIGAVRRDANTSLVDTTNEIAPLQVNATGELKVAQIQALPAGTNAIGKLAANDGVDIGDVTINNSTGASAVNIQDGGNSITVDYATTGSGTATGALRVELPTNGTGTVGLNAGSNAIGKLASNSGVDIGDVDVTSTTFPTPVSTSTYSPSSFQNLGANATLNVKASAGNVFSLYCNNENAADRYIQLHNTATTPAGGATPLYTFRVPAGGDVMVGTDFFTNAGANFGTGIAFAFSTTKDTYTAGTAGDQSTIIHYK